MVNKKGIIRIIEATIAIILVLTAFLLLNVRNKPTPSREDLTSIMPPLLDEVARNETLREEIVKTYNVHQSDTLQSNAVVLHSIEDFLKPRLNNPSLNFSIRVCSAQELCYLEPFPKDATSVYGAERFVTADIDSPYIETKKLKMFLWRR